MYSIQTMPKLFSYFFMNSKSERGKKIRRERFVVVFSTELIIFYYYFRQKKIRKENIISFLNSSTFNFQQQKKFKLMQKVQTVIIPIQDAR